MKKPTTRGLGAPRATLLGVPADSLRSWPLFVLFAALSLAACEQETDVGAPCTLQAPCTDRACGFGPTETHVDKSSSQCEDACLVHRLDNGTGGAVLANPEVLCDAAGQPAGCVTKAQLEDAVYCSCRCNGPKDAKGFCECPDGFECALVLSSGKPEDAGYCRKMPSN